MKDEIPPISTLNRVSLIVWTLPTMFVLVCVLLMLPAVFVWALIEPHSASRFADTVTAWVDAKYELLKQYRAKLARKEAKS